MNDNVSNQMADAQVELADKPVTTDEQKAKETLTFQTPEITGQEVKEDTTPVVI